MFTFQLRLVHYFYQLILPLFREEGPWYHIICICTNYWHGKIWRNSWSCERWLLPIYLSIYLSIYLPQAIAPPLRGARQARAFHSSSVPIPKDWGNMSLGIRFEILTCRSMLGETLYPHYIDAPIECWIGRVQKVSWSSLDDSDK